MLRVADHVLERHDLHHRRLEVEGIELIDVQLQVGGAVLVRHLALALLRG